MLGEQGEKLTNKQIGHKVSWNKTQLVERVLSHARGSRTLEIEVLDDDDDESH